MYEKFDKTRATIPGMEDCVVELHCLRGSARDSLLHWHHALELSLLLQGRVEYYANKTWKCNTPGDILLVNSGDIHLTRNASGVDTLKNLVIIISDRWIKSLVPEENEPFFAIKKNAAEYGNIVACMRRIADYMDNPFPYSNLLINRELTDILYTLFSKFHKPEYAPNLSNAMAKEIILYINEHYSENLSVKLVAARFGLQENYFCRYFKAVSGTTFHQYLSLVRLNSALSLFVAEQGSALHCALEAGFSSEKVMIDWCKKIYQCTPSHYKAKLVNNLLD